MKREFLQSLLGEENPLSKEAVDAIMAENGRDIENAKAGFADYQDLKQRLEELEKLDAEGLRQEAAQWQERFLQAQQEHTAQVEAMRFEMMVEKAVTAAQGRNIKAISALLDLPAIAAAEKPEEALHQALQTLQQESSYLFGSQTPPPYARGTGTRNGEETFAQATLAGALREKFERK